MQAKDEFKNEKNLLLAHAKLGFLYSFVDIFKSKIQIKSQNEKKTTTTTKKKKIFSLHSITNRSFEFQV